MIETAFFQTEQGAQASLTIPSLFLQTFVAVFFHLSDLLPPYQQLIYDHFHCHRCCRDQTFFHPKKGFSLYLLFETIFLVQLANFFR